MLRSASSFFSPPSSAGPSVGSSGSFYSALSEGSSEPRVRKNREKGLRLLEQASRSVHMAMVELASAHECGEHGLAVDEVAAFRLF